jgi:2'-5' RNA ligase
MSEPRRERRHRLFFALWPDESIRDRIVDATAPHLRAAGGRSTPRANLHVTLAFLGGVAESRLAPLTDAARRIASPTFDLVLDRVEHWRRQRLLSLEPSTPPPALDELIAKLRRALAASEFELESRPFRAHLTLARDARAPRGVEPAIAPIVWRVTELSLVESTTAPQGSRYTRLQSWPLVTANPG